MEDDSIGDGGGRESTPSRQQELAWAAGLFEGEGTLSCKPQGQRGSGAQLRLGMTDRDVVERFRDVMGCGGMYVHKPGTGSHKPLHTWYLYEAAQVVDAIEALLPWFGERRSAKAYEVLAVAKKIGLHKGKRTHCPNGHPYEGSNLILEPIKKGDREYFARRCRTCRTEQSRANTRRRLGITPDRYRK